MPPLAVQRNLYSRPQALPFPIQDPALINQCLSLPPFPAFLYHLPIKCFVTGRSEQITREWKRPQTKDSNPAQKTIALSSQEKAGGRESCQGG